MTVTNKDSFKFTTTHLMQKMLNGNTVSAAAAQSNGNNGGSVSTRNMHNNKENVNSQNNLILQRY